MANGYVVIDRKKYNWKEATLVARMENEHNCSDFRFEEEELYRTKKGNWFMYGRGGALSKYSQPCGNGSSNGSAWEALEDYEAQDWLEENGFNDEILKYFPDIEEA